MDIKGKLVQIINPDAKSQGQTKTGEKWMKHTVLVEYQGGDYPKRFVATIFSKETANRWAAMALELNKTYEFGLDIDAHEWNGRWFNDLSVWKATPVEDENAGTAGQALMSNAALVAAKFPPQQIHVQQMPQQPAQPVQPVQPTQNELPF